MSARLAALAAALLLSPAALAQSCPPQATWPDADGGVWPTQPVDTTAKAAAIAAMESYIFTLTGTDAERQGLRTDGLVIIKDGKLIYEHYGRGYDATKRHLSWSVAKSFSSALTGVAVQQGALQLSDSICKYIPGYSGPVCNITVGDLIVFSSGLAWQEGYEHESYQASSVISMFFGSGHHDHLKHILTHRIAAPPGTQWLYSTGEAELLSAVAKRALKPRFGDDAFWTLFFDKIYMPTTALEEDELGTPNGGSHLFATPRDYAKFGYLFLNDGCWKGERILPQGWVATSTTPSAVFKASSAAAENIPSGYMWWLNKSVVTPSGTRPRPWPNAPDDAYTAIGHWGQYVVVVPSEHVVIVRTGDDRNESVDLGVLIPLALEVAR